MRIFVAPMQGYTDAVFRHFHKEVYGVSELSYLTPFVRVEKGEARSRDMRDVTSVLNENHRPAGQIIFKDFEEFKLLTDCLILGGVREINLNIGCPFVPQCRRGRGAAMVGNAAVLEQVSEYMNSLHGVEFSLKMRLGADREDEWMRSAEVINRMPLSYVAVHARVGADQYCGRVRYEAFERLADTVEHPIVYNGDLNTPEDIDRILEKYPQLRGVMLGRGLVGRPSVFNEWIEGESWSRQKRLEYLSRLHTLILEYYARVLCGEAQVLSKVKPFWDYAEWEIGRKSRKAISKAGGMSRYLSAVDDLFGL